MFLHIFFILERTGITKTHVVYVIYKYGSLSLKHERNWFHSRCDECCSLAMLHLLRCGCILKPEKGLPHRAIYVLSSFLKPVLGGRSYFYITRAGSPRRVTSSAERVNAFACPNDFLRLRFSGAPYPAFAKRSSDK